MSDEILKEAKFVKNLSIFDNEDDYDEDLDYESENEETDELDYFYDTIDIIHNNLLDFVKEKDLILCEYLSKTNLEQFIIENFDI